MNESTPVIRFLYGTAVGRCLTKLILKSHLDRGLARLLGLGWSRVLIGGYARRNGIELAPGEKERFGSFQAFFARTREPAPIDAAPEELISPCDGLLSVFPIRDDSSFAIKNSHYRLEDLIEDRELAGTFRDGTCLIFRLCPTDYHHYCYIDEGWQGAHHFIPGTLHSVQPIACETYPVYTLNSRCWSLLETKHFGPVIQIEIGALLVGGIVNDLNDAGFVRGSEKGHFELAGSTIVLLFQKGRVSLLPSLGESLADGKEVRVRQAERIGRGCPDGAPEGGDAVC